MSVKIISNAKRATMATFSELLDEYMLALQSYNRSTKTTTWYREILDRYFNFLSSNSLLKPVDQLGRQELTAYILYLQQVTRWANSPHIKKATGKLSPYSIQGHVRAIKAFWGWLERDNYIQSNPLGKFPLPKVPQKPVQVLSNEQIRSLLAQIDRLTPKGTMYYTILLLLLDTGIRISELAHIKIPDLNLQHGWIQVWGKGQKLRTVPISNLTKKEITDHPEV